MRLLVFVVPLALSFLVAMWLSQALPVPEPFGERLVRWLGIAAVSTLALAIAHRLMRTLLPLSALLSLTLVFPDAAPSRFRIALRSLSARGLERSLQADSPHASTQEAAERLLVLVSALSRHDRLTRGHSERVRAYAIMIGEELDLPQDELDRLRWAALLHDVGKLEVPAEILNKPGRLTDEEFAIVRQHTVHGAKLTHDLREWLGDSVDAVDQHHEQWAGGGYPYGLRGSSITRAARIVSVADAFDVMTSARSYKKPIPPASARSELERCAGSQFDPEVVRAMLNLSLGTLWRAMGPFSWAAQLRLFPRQVAQAGAPVMTSAAVAVSIAVTAVAAGITNPGTDAAVAASPVVASAVADRAPSAERPPPPTAVREAAAGDAPDPSVPAVTIAPGTSIAPPPTSAVDTAAAATATATATTTVVEAIGPLPPTDGPVIIVRPTTTVRGATPGPPAAPVPAPGAPTSTTQVTTTVAATTVAPTTTVAAPPATTATTTTTTTTTAPPPPPPTAGTFTIGSSGPGDVAWQPVLTLGPARPPQNATVANYDVDRNPDPGATVVRTRDGLATSNPAGLLVWRFPDTVDAIPASASATLYASAADGVDGGDELFVRAGLYRCNPTRLNCDRLRVRTVVLPAPAPGQFVPVVFDLSASTFSLAPTGFDFELRFAVVDDSDENVWVAYDAADAPASVTFGP